MTKEENLHWLDVEIRMWESECQSKHPIKEALYAARKALEREPCSNCIEFKRYAKQMGFELEQEPVLDKISAEVKALSPEPTAFDVVDGNPVKDAIWETIGDVLRIIGKYKTESEVKVNENEK